MPFDWAGAMDHASRMSEEAIRFAIRDALDTLPYADDLDREDGQCRGGRYRDQISVLRGELKQRGLPWRT